MRKWWTRLASRVQGDVDFVTVLKEDNFKCMQVKKDQRMSSTEDIMER